MKQLQLDSIFRSFSSFLPLALKPNHDDRGFIARQEVLSRIGPIYPSSQPHCSRRKQPIRRRGNRSTDRVPAYVRVRARAYTAQLIA